MYPASPSERIGDADERPTTQRPAEPAPQGEALVQHLVDRLARAEADLRTARENVGVADHARALISRVARGLATRTTAPIAEVVREMLPTLGEWCLVDEEDGGVIRRQLVARDAAEVTDAQRLAGDIPCPSASAVGLPRVLRGGRIERLATLPAAPDAIESEEHLVLERLALGALLVVPVFLGGRPVAALTFGRAAHQPDYDERDERLSQDLASLLSLGMAERLASAAAETSVRAKSEFLAVMSHELRTPLNVIAGYAQLLEMGLRGPLTDPQRDAVARIIRGQEHLLELVDDVLTFARLTSGRVTLVVEAASARDLLSLASDLLAHEFAAHGIRFVISPCDDELQVLADRDRTVQVLRQLLENALKFTAEGGEVALGCEADPAHVRFVVTDNGPGIAHAQHAAIFEPFVQAERAHTRSAEGTGLGLAIGRELAERMSGSLTVTSEPGQGSRFVLCLPRAERSPDTIDSPAAQG